MRKVREVLRLKYACGVSERVISRSLGIGRTAIGVGNSDRLRRRSSQVSHRLSQRHTLCWNNMSLARLVSPITSVLRLRARLTPPSHPFHLIRDRGCSPSQTFSVIVAIHNSKTAGAPRLLIPRGTRSTEVMLSGRRYCPPLARQSVPDHRSSRFFRWGSCHQADCFQLEVVSFFSLLSAFE